MKKQIWKYTLEVTDEQIIQMPLDAYILCAQLQDGKICLWALVSPENKKDSRVIAIYGTGNPVTTPNLSYIGTVQMNSFVWHVFEVVN